MIACAAAIVAWLIAGLLASCLFRIIPPEDPMDPIPLLSISDSLATRAEHGQLLTAVEMTELAGTLRDLAFAGPPGGRQNVITLPLPKAWPAPGGAA
ncbi:MAG: hypothetical protein HIU82_02295 [Proteobacteria bacterium]|nr:hypothetical protein [Pseudomonadota bacterium]